MTAVSFAEVKKEELPTAPKTVRVVQRPPVREETRHDDSRDVGDVQASGMAVMVACVELTVSIFIVIFTHQYKFSLHTLLQFLMFTVLMSDVFAGLLVTCYLMSFQAITLVFCFIGETFLENRSMLTELFPKIAHVPMVYSYIAFAMLCWTVFRFFVARRALAYLYYDRFEDVEAVRHV